ncbi:MAG: TFIIB-type zinc finger domain-containing protein [Eubacteriales bacterium]|nr:TFIIB-type zinc finger domain-containing protein [Eubacteriales bacterium]
MKKIVCELCDGTEFAKADGMFVCSNCGTKYSAEEAKNMMRDVEVDVATPVKTTVAGVTQGNNNQQYVDNLLLLANNAYSAKNNEETEKYCNKIIEYDVMCYKAWFLKGKAIAWSSKLNNNKSVEAAHSFKKAVDFAPDEEKKSLTDQAIDELKHLCMASVSIRQDVFSKYPDDESVKEFLADLVPLIEGMTVLLSTEGIDTNSIKDSLRNVFSVHIFNRQFMRSVMREAESAGIPKEFFSQVAQRMALAAMEGFCTAMTNFSHKKHPISSDLEETLKELDNCGALLEAAIYTSDNDYDRDITCLKTKIQIEEFAIDMKAYEKPSSERMEIQLTGEAKNLRRERISYCNERIREIENKAREKAEEEKKTRIDAYWSEHAEEKAKLDSKLKKLSEKKDEISREITDINTRLKNAETDEPVASQVEKDRIKEQIKALTNRKSKLGLFAVKEKKQIGEEISSLEGDVCT